MMPAKRGELWFASLDPIEGHEQAGHRPVLVLSVDTFNASRAELVTVLPLTSRARPGNPFRIEVPAHEGGLTSNSYVIGEQIRTISTLRLGRKLGVVSPTTLAKIADVVRVLLGL